METEVNAAARNERRWSTLWLDGFALATALIALPTLGLMFRYVRCTAAFRGCGTTLESLHHQIDCRVLLVLTAAIVGWGGYAIAQSRMTKLEKWITICPLAIAMGTCIAWGTHEADQILRKPAHAEDIVPGMVMRGIGAKT